MYEYDMYIYICIYICSCYIHVFEHMAFIMCIYILVFPYIHLIYCHMYIYIEAAMAQNSIGFRLIQRKIVKLKILPKDQGEKQTNLHCTLRFA